MTFNKFLIGTLLGGIAAFLIGFILYGVLLSDFFDSQKGVATNLLREPFDFLSILYGDFTFASLLTYLFGYFGNVRDFKSGAVAGAIIGFLATLAINMFEYANMNVYSFSAHMTDALLGGITGAVSGGLIGWYLGRDDKGTEATTIPTTRFLIASLIGFAATFIGGFILYGFVFSETLAANTDGVGNNVKEPIDMMAMMLANLSVGALISYVLSRWTNMRTLWLGAVVGAIVGFLSCFSFDAWQHGQFNLLTVKGIYVDSIVYGLMTAITGAVVAWYLNRVETAA
jgi:gas vesicle protein